MLGRTRVRLELASAGLAEQLLPALRHIEAPDDGEPAFRIYAWDGQADGSVPRAPWPPGAVRARGEIDGFNTDRFHVAFNVHSSALSAADLDAGYAFFWTPQLASLAAYEKAAPFRTLIGWIVQSWQGQLAHASAVVGDAGGALIVGPSGAGKSTTALACWQSGLGYLSDDYCALLADRGQVTIASLYATAKLDGAQLRRAWPDLAERKPPDWAVGNEKVILALHDELRRQPTSGRLVAIVRPVIVPQRRCALQPCSPAEALTALAPSSIVQTPLLAQRALAFYARVASQTDCFRLLLGANLSEVPVLMKQLLGNAEC